MKKITYLIIAICLSTSAYSQCIYGHEGNYSAFEYYPTPYPAWITIDDSVSFTIYNFFNVPPWGFDETIEDTIPGKMDCTNDSVHFTTVNYSSYPLASFRFSGVGIFYQDSLVADFIYILWSSYGIDTIYPHIVYKTVPIGIGPNFTTPNLQVFPNPVADLVTIKLPNSNDPLDIRIFNTLGLEVLSVENRTKLDLSTLSSGIYFIYARTKNNKLYTKNILKL